MTVLDFLASHSAGATITAGAALFWAVAACAIVHSAMKD